MASPDKLIDFFRREFQAEERSGFRRLSRIPNTSVKDLLRHYTALSETERLAYVDCGAHWAYKCYRLVAGVPEIDHTQHPYYRDWSHALGTYHDRTKYACSQRSVPSLRRAVQQYKMDIRRGIQSRISAGDFDQASAVLAHCVKGPELHKRVREVLRPLGYHKRDHFGYWCRQAEREFCVSVSYGGAIAHHQLEYGVKRPEFHPKPIFAFEIALGFVMGNCWDYIVEENVDDSLSLLADLVSYSYALPDRIRAEAT